jgi:NAD(P)-dependent dehydrogenase (short-subunit alcohol dehydrogenase family)
LRAVPLATQEGAVRPPAGAEVWVTADSPGLGRCLEKRIGALGYRARLVAPGELRGLPLPANLGGLLIVAPAAQPGDDLLRDALFGLQHAGPGLRQCARRGGAAFATASRLDGTFGLSAVDPHREPVDGGLAGLAKTARHEWPEVACKALDLAPDFPTADEAAAALVEELFHSGPAEVGLSPRGRVTLERVPQALPAGEEAPFEPGDVVVVSGGARGVTAEVALALARAFGPTLVLLGRSPEPKPEPGWLAELSGEAEIKRELGSRTGASLKEVGEQYRHVLAQREVRHNLARVRAAAGVVGGRAEYRAVDVRDARAVAGALAAVRREFGPVRGLVHGAGVLADARIEDKTAEQFDRVFHTKVGGLRALMGDIDPDELRALVLFSSSTARFGRTGQVDYAMTNEVLNKVARQQARRRPGCRVLSFNWGPWDGGMVTPGLKKVFAGEGIGLIPLEAGARHLVDELRAGPSGDVEVVVLAGAAAALPPALPAAFERALSVADCPVLAAHVFDGRPVLPLALVLEWLAHAALHQSPGLVFHGCDELRVLHGVILDGPLTVRVGAAKAVKRDGLYVAPAELRSTRPDGREVLHARAEVVLAAELPPAPPGREPPPLGPYALPPEEVYRQGLLFHGPALQGLERVDGCDERGIAGVVRAAPPPAEWVHQPLRSRWLSDPLVLDGAFQLLVLWAQDRRRAPALPCYVRRYRQWRRAFPAGGARVVAEVTRATDLKAVADIDLLDGAGGLVARLEGHECTIDANLRHAFARNELTVAVR